jgi:ubiquinone/menaquinone biosynthesis C-methylase UbiE
MAPEQVCDEFHEVSYRYHQAHWKAITEDQNWRRLIDSWFDTSSADYWRHRRMYEAAQHLGGLEGERWFTVGDGQFGLDSVRLRERGVRSVLPTDIGDATLRDAKARGIIEDYQIQNAERLSFADRSFDYAFCKEAFHHFPRPFLALYEMLRVARKGVILVEPQDQAGALLRQAIYWARKLRGKLRHFDGNRYEDSGNYIYSVSEREMEKACLGINLPCIAFKGLTDLYVKGGEFEPASFASTKFLRMRAVILVHGLLVKLGLSRHNVLMCCIFKEEPTAAERRALMENGWRLIDLPRNPYAQGEKVPLPTEDWR